MAIKISKNRLDLDGKPLQNVLHQDLDHTTTPANPPAANLRIYAKSDNLIYKLTPAGAESLVGGGARYINIPASSFVLKTTGAAERVLVEGTNVTHYELRYDATSDENAFTPQVELPDDYASGTVTINLKWKAAATSGSVVWAVDYLAVSDDDIWDAAFTTGSTATDAAMGTAEDLNNAQITFTLTASASE